jgi:hypothetical protein
MFLLDFEEEGRYTGLFCRDIQMEAYLLFHIQSMLSTLQERYAGVDAGTDDRIHNQYAYIFRRDLFFA